MTVQGFTDQGSTTADTLLAGEFPRVSELATITGGSYKRGTVLKYKPFIQRNIGGNVNA